MKITYKIEQYDVDDFKVTITNPDYLNEVSTRIHNPHFLLSELQQNIETNLTKNIHRFCNKHKKYADILYNKSFKFEFEPDKFDRDHIHENSCWFYTDKFIDDTHLNISDKDRDEIYYENYRRYKSHAAPVLCLKMNRECEGRPIVFQKTFKQERIDANTLIKHFGIRRPTIDYWNWIQRDWCSTTGNNKNDVFFPRYKKEGGRNIYTIREINRFFRLLYDNDRPMYDFLVKNFKAQRKRA